ncbi:hypothetical protein FDECE_519 [Fusarium decemcellulare]|nr:hypothetical protein FDECE_519 [Fusarium decemcellulare]
MIDVLSFIVDLSFVEDRPTSQLAPEVIQVFLFSTSHHHRAETLRTIDDFEWHDATHIPPRSQDEESGINPGYLLSVADPRQTQYNFGTLPPQFGYPHPMTVQPNTHTLLYEGYNTDTIPIQGGILAMPATGQGIPIAQSNNPQGGYQAIPTTSQTSLLQLPSTYMNTPIPANFQHHGRNFGVQPDHADADTAMTDAWAMSGCPAAPGSQPPEKMICPITVEKSRARPKKKNAEEEPPKGWHEKWEPWRETIKYLRFDQKHTIRELEFEMASLHGFKFAVLTYGKLGEKWDEFKGDNPVFAF